MAPKMNKIPKIGLSYLLNITIATMLYKIAKVMKAIMKHISA